MVYAKHMIISFGWEGIHSICGSLVFILQLKLCDLLTTRAIYLSASAMRFPHEEALYQVSSAFVFTVDG